MLPFFNSMSNLKLLFSSGNCMIQAIQAQNLQVENSIHVEENSDQDPSV